MRTTRNIPWRPPVAPDPCPPVGQASWPVVPTANAESGGIESANAESGCIESANAESGYIESANAESGYIESANAETGCVLRHPFHPSFANNPLLWVSTFLPLQPDPPQSAILQSTHSNLILNCSRQWGKTTVIAAKALHFALFRPASTILVAAPSERQSVTLLRRLRSFIRALGIAPRAIPWVPLSVLLPNSSEIIALPASADTTRGFTAHLMIFDEASRVPDSLYNALSPARATTAAPLWLLSTPNGCSGFFYDAWHENNPDFGDPKSTLWTRFLVPATQCPRISPEFLKHERLMLGNETYRQEYLCEFITPGGRYFSDELLRSAVDPTLVPLFLKPLWSRP